MDFRIIRRKERTSTPWQGGETSQIAILPGSSSFPNRDFLWRISTTQISSEETDFTLLPGYERYLMVLSGDIVLAHKANRVTRLRALDRDHFDGGQRTKSFGQAVDYNLIYQSGLPAGMESIPLNREALPFPLEEDPDWEKTALGIFCVQGYALWRIGEETHLLHEGDQAVAIFSQGDLREMDLMGEGTAIKTWIRFEEKQEAHQRTAPSQGGEPGTKFTFRDYKQAWVMANTRFRGSRLMFRGLRKIWYDDALVASVDRMERLSLPTIILMLGFAVAGIFTVQMFGREALLPGLLIWLCIHVFVIAPGMYLAAAPAPFSSHVRSTDEMDPEEKEHAALRNSREEKARRILDKYSRTGKNHEMDQEDRH